MKTSVRLGLRFLVGASLLIAPLLAQTGRLSVENWRGVNLLAWAEDLPWPPDKSLLITYYRNSEGELTQFVISPQEPLRPNGCTNPGKAYCYDCKGKLIWERNCCRDFPSDCSVHEDDCWEDGGARFCVEGIMARFLWHLTAFDPATLSWESFFTKLHHHIQGLPLQNFERIWVYHTLNGDGSLSLDSIKYASTPSHRVRNGSDLSAGGSWIMSMVPVSSERQRFPCKEAPKAAPVAHSEEAPLFPSCTGYEECLRFPLKEQMQHRITFARHPERSRNPSPSPHGMSVYPNPTQGQVTILLPVEGTYTIRIRHLVTGQIVEEQMVTGKRYITTLPSTPGMYRVEAKGISSHHFWYKLVVKE
ncbi:MAG: T9SS type A sorting domain-containing protein [Bacteroidia bacterium]|nr:T9SS type A sorting domain-containing protein [Bacteroidia bacterium]